jgi:hypothetical protein
MDVNNGTCQSCDRFSKVTGCSSSPVSSGALSCPLPRGHPHAFMRQQSTSVSYHGDISQFSLHYRESCVVCELWTKGTKTSKKERMNEWNWRGCTVRWVPLINFIPDLQPPLWHVTTSYLCIQQPCFPSLLFVSKNDRKVRNTHRHVTENSRWHLK